jgi:hypothetical protein
MALRSDLMGQIEPRPAPRGEASGEPKTRNESAKTRRPKEGQLIGPVFALSLLAGPAAACTICHSPTALGLRHLIVHHDFARNAAAVAAPLPLLAAAIYLAVKAPTGRRGPRA